MLTYKQKLAISYLRSKCNSRKSSECKPKKSRDRLRSAVRRVLKGDGRDTSSSGSESPSPSK